MSDREGQGESGAAGSLAGMGTAIPAPCTNCNVYEFPTHLTHEVYEIDYKLGLMEIKTDVEIDIYQCTVCGFVFTEVSHDGLFSKR